jgi:two-component system CheB/CheR fusion protein
MDNARLFDRARAEVQERARLELTLRESEERFRQMADNAPVMIWVVGAEGCEFVNREYSRFFGRTAESVRGLEWARLFPADERESDGDRWETAYSSREPFDAQLLLRREDGQQRALRCSGVPRFGGDGTFMGYVGCAVDITDIKRSEQSLREADRRKDEFLATLAHELRNPLAPLRNALRILSLDPTAQGRDEMLSMMERQIDHLVRLVDDLLEISRLTRGDIELRRKSIDLATVIQGAVETSMPLIEAGRHRFALSMPEESIILEGDALRLAQVFSNLLNNAAQHTNEEGQIQLTARHDGREAIVSVRDSGVGIAPESLPHLFDPFAPAQRSQGGLAVGLALAKRLVEMHGGRVEARSDGPGAGSEFVVRLPLEPNRGPIPARELDARSIETVRLPRRRLIVVDDNVDSANSLGLLLELMGSEVRVTHTGAAAIEAVRASVPDVMFVDLGMPEMDGCSLAREIRAKPECTGVVLVAVSGWSQIADRRRSKEAGFDHHLVKPVEVAALESLLRTLSLSTAGARRA